MPTTLLDPGATGPAPSRDGSAGPVEPATSHLPPIVDAVLAPHRAELATTARGRVLVVAGSLPISVGGAISDVAVSSGSIVRFAGRVDPLASSHVPPEPAAARFDTIVSVGGLLAEPDLPAALEALASLLAPGGRMWMVESTRSWRLSAGLISSLPGVWGSVGHLHLQRDLPGALWSCGLAPLTVERFVVPTLIAPLRNWAHITAARPEELGEGVWP